jgi:hypothetical protein
MSNQPLTDEEYAWANENAEAVRSLMANSKRKVHPQELSENPVEAAALLLLQSLEKVSNKVAAEIERKRASLERYVRMVNDPKDADDLDYIQGLSEEKTHLEGEIVKFEKHLAALNSKIDALTSDPSAAFLPLGTVVRFVGVPKYESSLSLSDDRKSYPVVGSVGVVTRLNRSGEYPISVSMREGYKTGWGDEVFPDYERIPTYCVDSDMLVVEEYGRLPDGNEYLGYGFNPTHIREPDNDGKQGTEMVLEAGGYFWRFHDFGGMQSIEALQAFDRMDEMSWIEGPLEQYLRPKAPKPSP